MEKLKRITYDVNDNAAAPEPDQFLVSLTARGAVSTVYHIAEVRQVKSKVSERRYSLGVYTADDLKAHTEVKEGIITVKGEVAFPLVWYSRGPVTPKFHPSEINERQVFGDFTQRQTSGAACLLVLLDGQVYRYGQWSTLEGIQHVLGWCKFVDDAAFVEVWGNARPSWQMPTPLASSYKVPESGVSAQGVIQAFIGQVQHEAAVLYYYAPETWAFSGWMGFLPKGKAWADELNASAAEQVQALWYNHQIDAYNLPADPYGFCPATYPEVMARIQHQQNEALRRDAENPALPAASREYLSQLLHARGWP